jgi:hypothetical protein
MTIEEQFRDTTGCRFGVRLEWTQFRTPTDLARFTLLVGVAFVAKRALLVSIGVRFIRAHPPRPGSVVSPGCRPLRRSDESAKRSGSQPS